MNDRSSSPPESDVTFLSLEDQKQQLADYERKLVVFGTDVSSIPCFRNSFLYGLTSGFGAGIAHFAFFSKVANATRFGVYSCCGVVLGYWVYCRYNFAVARFKYKQITHAMKMTQELAGTPHDISVKVQQAELLEEEKTKQS